MASHHEISATFLCFIVLALSIDPSHAQNSPEDYVNAHNAYRAEVGVEPMKWNDTLAAYAEKIANKRINHCEFEQSGGPYGENLAQGDEHLTGAVAVQLWGAEKSYYDPSSNSCRGEPMSCYHYTQVVWSKSTRVGCARVQCKNGTWYVICNYDECGNVEGERPY